MSYLLDTNACIALLNGKPASVGSRMRKVVGAKTNVFVSSIVAFELWHGVAKSASPELNTKRLLAFFAGPVLPLPFEDEDAQSAGTVRAQLERLGMPIGAYDLLIAGQALRHKLTLVTANHSEFSRIKGLGWQDWAV